MLMLMLTASSRSCDKARRARSQFDRSVKLHKMQQSLSYERALCYHSLTRSIAGDLVEKAMLLTFLTLALLPKSNLSDILTFPALCVQQQPTSKSLWLFHERASELSSMPPVPRQARLISQALPPNSRLASFML